MLVAIAYVFAFHLAAGSLLRNREWAILGAAMGFACWPLHQLLLGEPLPLIAEITGRRLFVVACLATAMLARRYRGTRDLTATFVVVALLAAVPFLVGILEPLGTAYDLTRIGIFSVGSFVGVFQNAHSASLAYALIGVLAVGLGTHGRHRTSWIALACISLVLTLLTFARAGLLAWLVGCGVVSLVGSGSRRSFRVVVVATMSVAALFVIVGDLGNAAATNARSEAYDRIREPGDLDLRQVANVESRNRAVELGFDGREDCRGR